uniref:Gfo/Idh/MocA family protein n=1 Tax=Paenibacillus arenilitoris TaxID=2772299 RepID=UPI001CC24646|nr:Gfo/Idh/MocA family oxidoreductase [Paenibacillus arenilitoris]
MKQRFVLVGHGAIARTYLEAMGHLASCRIVGVVGRHAVRVQKFAEKHGIPCSGTKLAEVATASGANAVIVCTPNGIHEEGVMAAADLGLHVLCEKPLHIDPVRQRAMVKRCEQRGVVLGVAYIRRFTPHLLWIKALMEAGKLGRVTVADISLKHYRDPAYYEDDWHGTRAIDGGGPFMQQGIHLIDMVQWLCGGWDKVISAACFTLHHDIEVEDHGYAVVRYRNGAVGSIAASTACVGMSSERLEISGTFGSVSADFGGLLELDVPGVEIPEFRTPSIEYNILFQQLLIDFNQAIEKGRAPVVTGASGSRATELVHEIYRAADRMK